MPFLKSIIATIEAIPFAFYSFFYYASVYGAKVWVFSHLIFLYIFIPSTLITTLVLYAQTRNGPSACSSRITDGQPGFIGIPDFYGLGIRLGFYFQWAASIIANVLLPDDQLNLVITYAFLSLAFELALIVLIFIPGCVFDAEVIIILFIFFGGVFNIMLPLGGAIHLYDSIYYGITPLCDWWSGNRLETNNEIPQNVPMKFFLLIDSVGEARVKTLRKLRGPEERQEENLDQLGGENVGDTHGSRLTPPHQVSDRNGLCLPRSLLRGFVRG